MDGNLGALNPRNTSPISNTDQDFNVEFVDSRVQLPICDEQSANVECESSKNPRATRTTRHQAVPSLPKTETEHGLQFRRDHLQFGHGTGDARRLLPYSRQEDQVISPKMRVCRRFSNGQRCQYGERCIFLHPDPEKCRKTCAINVVNSGPVGFSRNRNDRPECDLLGNSSSNPSRVSQKPMFWKTRFCHKWEATGTCSFGADCCFAHGHRELQKLGPEAATEQGNVSISKMQVPASTEHLPPRRADNGAACEQQMQMQGVKCLLKWKGSRKINGIYADWIEGMPLVHNSHGKMAC
ncbi:zinc finger CCCH domain-containing protein 56-like [Diospyros lotus]|uniref:zinc finger CCCH domain-containing protein 56-like n=1 Tax=Diospyros lotus TaxID=55363 RepID=UPI00225717AF|nr:zinc finger CCCH domain-containing protein 56-like [Diospyros lotus]